MVHETIKNIKTDKLSKLVGGRYALTVLISKRLRSVNAGAPLLVEPIAGEYAIESICREIEEGKIWLEMPEIAGVETAGDTDEISQLFDMK